MPTWLWMVVRNRDQARVFLAEAIARGDTDDIAYGEFWLAERQRVVDEMAELYGYRV
ncbi:hypothetical protein ACFQ46_07025 [Kineococcus sp. GCM10028916]|uniref:hypothetical protein n=1 Tax=Kineococcus sp. GCM10028916 TaxID=3273394 RepID=UPI00363F7988